MQREVLSGLDGGLWMAFAPVEGLDNFPGGGKTKRGKGKKWMVLGDGEGVSLGVRLESASPAEVTLADATLQEVRVPRPKGRLRQKPKRVIADWGTLAPSGDCRS